MTEKLKYISNNLRAYRNKMGYTQEDMAKLLEVSRKTYCDYEVNPIKLKVSVLQQIADVLSCNLSDFFENSKVTNSNIMSSQTLYEELEEYDNEEINQDKEV